MLRIKYFEEFKDGNPFVVVISDQKGFQAAQDFFKGKKGAFLNDQNITAFSDIAPLSADEIYLNEKECGEILGLLQPLIASDRPCHVYFDIAALGDEIEVIFSCGEYDDLF